VGMSTIGHMGYFRQQAAPLWAQTFDWFASA
jgi:predicted alpha/beta hydrolase